MVMQQLDKALQSLEKEFNKWKVKVLEAVNTLERQEMIAAKIGDAFCAAQQTLGLGEAHIGGCQHLPSLACFWEITP